MIEVWAANLKAKMFLFSIKDSDIADKLGVSRQYVNMVIRGKRSPKANVTRESIEAALNELIAER